MCGLSPYQLHEPLPVVDRAYLAAQDPVQDLADGEGEGAGEQHEQLGQPDRVRPHRQAVPGADGLGKKWSFLEEKTEKYFFSEH